MLYYSLVRNWCTETLQQHATTASHILEVYTSLSVITPCVANFNTLKTMRFFFVCVHGIIIYSIFLEMDLTKKKCFDIWHFSKHIKLLPRGKWEDYNFCRGKHANCLPALLNSPIHWIILIIFFFPLFHFKLQQLSCCLCLSPTLFLESTILLTELYSCR